MYNNGAEGDYKDNEDNSSICSEGSNFMGEQQKTRKKTIAEEDDSEDLESLLVDLDDLLTMDYLD